MKYFLLVFGSLLSAAGYKLFILPVHLAPGGVSGLATIINYFSGIDAGVLVFVINVPLFIFARKRLGKNFFIRSAVGTALLSLFIEILPKIAPAGGDMLISSVFGGIMTGTGTALCFASGGSTGGVDIVTKLVLKKRTDATSGNVMLLIDSVIVLLSIFVFGIKNGLYSLLTVLVATLTVDVVANGYSGAKVYCIISDKSDEICKKIIEMGRGVTVLYAKKTFSGKDTEMLVCLVSRQDVIKMKNIIKKTDSTSFTFVLSAKEVLGNGFS